MSLDPSLGDKFPRGKYAEPEAVGERLEPMDGDERKVGTVTAVKVLNSPVRRTRALATDAIAGRMDPVEDQASVGEKLLVPRGVVEGLVVARDMQEVLRIANE